MSPDGKWIAFLSDETGSNQLYVRPFPDVDRGRWAISQGTNATSPVWSPDSRELFYIEPARREVVAVSITTAPEFETGTPRVLFRLPDDAYERHFATVDGKRFLIARQLPSATPSRATLVVAENWFQELRRRMANP